MARGITVEKLCKTLAAALRFLKRWQSQQQWLWAVGIRQQLGLAEIIADIERTLREVGYKEEMPPDIDIAALKAKYDQGKT